MADKLNSDVFSRTATQFLRAFVGVGSLRIAALVLGAVASILVARELGPAAYGQLVFALAVLNLLSIPSNNAVSPLLIRQVSAYEQGADWKAIKGLLRWTAGVSLAGCVFALLVLLIVLGWMFNLSPGTDGYIFLVGAPLLFIWAAAARVSGGLQGLNKVVLAQSFDWLIGPSLYLAIILSVIWLGTLSMSSVLFSMMASAAVSVVVGLVVLKTRLPPMVATASPSYDQQRWFSAWRSFMLIQAISVANLRAPVLLLGFYGGDTEAGLFRAADNIATFLSLSLLVANTVLGPQIARLYATGNIEALGRLARNVARGALALSLPPALLVLFFGAEILGFLFGEQYVSAYAVLVVLTIGQVANVAAGSVGLVLNMTGHEQRAVGTWGFALLLNVTLGILLIPLYGALGAAIAAVAATITWNLLLLYLARKLTGVNTAVF